jgi:excinuclease UvrABC ATPase subunit
VVVVISLAAAIQPNEERREERKIDRYIDRVIKRERERERENEGVSLKVECGGGNTRVQVRTYRTRGFLTFSVCVVLVDDESLFTREEEVR